MDSSYADYIELLLKVHRELPSNVMLVADALRF